MVSEFGIVAPESSLQRFPSCSEHGSNILGSKTTVGSSPENARDLSVELSASIVLEANGSRLGDMAQAVRPVADDRLQACNGGTQMPRFIQFSGEVWDFSRTWRSEGRPRRAATSVASPDADFRDKKRVLVLFRALIAGAASIVLLCCLAQPAFRLSSHFELSASIVLEANGSRLGDMAQAVRPVADDRLLCSASRG